MAKYDPKKRIVTLEPRDLECCFQPLDAKAIYGLPKDSPLG